MFKFLKHQDIFGRRAHQRNKIEMKIKYPDMNCKNVENNKFLSFELTIFVRDKN